MNYFTQKESMMDSGSSRPSVLPLPRRGAVSGAPAGFLHRLTFERTNP
jgi:hypothetical protein